MARRSSRGVRTKVNLYAPQHAGQEFISIDLVKANFYAMRLYDPELVGGANTYESFIERCFADGTVDPYWVGSKYIRQVIFGNCLPKKQRRIEKHVVTKMVRLLLEWCSPDDVVGTSHDEIIVRGTDEIWNRVANAYAGMPFRASSFSLMKCADHPYYWKALHEGRGVEVWPHPVSGVPLTSRVPNEGFEVKGVPSYLHAQVYKHVKGLPLSEEDLVFWFEGQIAHFDEPLFKDDSDDQQI